MASKVHQMGGKFLIDLKMQIAESLYGAILFLPRNTAYKIWKESENISFQFGGSFWAIMV